MSKATKSSKPKVPKMPKGEAEQVRIRRDLGHDFALKQDEHGRTRLIAGSVGARRVYEVSNDGHISTGGIVRVRKVDPLKGILSLTDRQRGAGLRYREDFELAAREGLKTGAFQERVDGGGMTATISARLLDNHAALHEAREAVVPKSSWCSTPFAASACRSASLQRRKAWSAIFLPNSCAWASKSSFSTMAQFRSRNGVDT